MLVILGIILLQLALIGALVFFIAKYAIFALSEGYEVPFVATPKPYLARVAEALDVHPGDTVYDLGSGDGRVIRYLAARFPDARFVGVERNPLLVAISRFRARNLTNATFVCENFYDVDMSGATKIYAYLKTKPLNELYARGVFKNVRLVSRAFKLHDQHPVKTVELTTTSGTHGEHMLYVYAL